MTSTYVPSELAALDHWLVWRLEEREGKATKVPYSARTGKLAKVNDPSSWSTLTEAQRRASQEPAFYAGIGFVITSEDGFVGIDLDKCRNPVTGEIALWAQAIVDELDSYAEVSPSGNGVHVWVKGVVPPGRRQSEIGGLYDQGRYLTWLGQPINGEIKPIAERTAELARIHARVFAPKPANGVTPTPIRPGLVDDGELIRRASAAKNGDKFRRLWDGDTSGHGGDDSGADLALCDALAFWTGKDPSAMDRLFRQSGLMRDKWDEKRPIGTYGSMTVAKAIEGTSETYRESRIGASQNGHATLPPKETAIEEAEGFPLTDLGNAERLVARHGDKLRYCGAWKAWLIWRETHWERDETNQVERYTKETVRSIYAEVSIVDDPQERKAISKHAVKSESEARIKAMISLASSEKTIPIEPSMLDADPWLFNVANGTIDLHTGELRAHRQSDLMTKLAPIVYNPEARLPLWEQFLCGATDSSAELMAFLQRAVGYSLTGSTREEKLFFVHGPSRTGKSTFLDAVKMVLGSYAAVADFETFLAQHNAGGPRQDIARLAGARFVMSIEVAEGRKLAEGLVKTITGGDEITARFLFGKEFEFRPSFKLWLAANSAPKARTDDDAIWNRIIRIPFDQVVPQEKRDPRVKLALRDAQIAGPALLAWAVKGCLAWQRDGLRIPQEVIASSEGYRLEVDRLASFMDDCCILDPEGWTWSSVLIEEYENWAKTTREKRPLRGKAFGDRLRARGCIAGRRPKGELGPTRGWQGIRMQEKDE